MTTVEEVEKIKLNNEAAYKRLREALSEGKDTTNEDCLQLLISTKVIKMLRVEGEDGFGDQVIRYTLEGDEALWDAYQIRKDNELSWKCGILGPITGDGAAKVPEN